MKLTILISPNKILQILLAVTVLLTLASSAGSLLGQMSIDNYFLVEMRESWIRLFDPNGEANIIAWYSACTLLLCSLHYWTMRVHTLKRQVFILEITKLRVHVPFILTSRSIADSRKIRDRYLLTCMAVQ